MPSYIDAEQILNMTDEMISEINSIVKEYDLRVLLFFDREKRFLGICICDNDKVNKLKKKHLKEGVGVGVGKEVIRPIMIGKN
jgi:hypothetical protein